jgi:hypothetical protein
MRFDWGMIVPSPAIQRERLISEKSVRLLNPHHPSNQLAYTDQRRGWRRGSTINPLLGIIFVTNFVVTSFLSCPGGRAFLFVLYMNVHFLCHRFMSGE